MDNLKLKDLLPYIGFGLMVVDSYDDKTKQLVGVISDKEDEVILSYNGQLCNRYISEIKPIFKSIDFIDHQKNVDLSPLDKSALKAYGNTSGRLVYKDLMCLASLHIDLCNAIPRGLAICDESEDKLQLFTA
ncbi:hypothetical protein [Sphingobacterium sp.]|uniref:hypothetical protein n=1 Tax=Sphingobacterium sp. TaxID=341027 RepID=UPI00289A2316|nr:hypothetical protein [Sphingobacterium sp.]